VAVTAACPRANAARLRVFGDVVGGEVAGLFLLVLGDAAAFFDDELSNLLLPVEGDGDATAFFCTVRRCSSSSSCTGRS
jgi:hypothetical protein